MPGESTKTRVLRAIQTSSGPLSVLALASLTGCRLNTVGEAVTTLTRAGLITRSGQRRDGYTYGPRSEP